jgi:hypothetical protein
MLDNLNSINPKISPLPSVPQALGELIITLSEEGPDAIVIDFAGNQVITYPRGSAEGRPAMSAESITSLLTEYTIEMLGHDIAHVEELLDAEHEDTQIAVFHHPKKEEEIRCHINSKSLTLQNYPTRVLSPNFLLLCCQGVEERFRLRGAMFKS